MTQSNSKNFKAIRVWAHYNIEIAAEADALFALACPKEELKWIDQWQYDMIYSDTGNNKNNCIFREKMSGLFVLNSPDIDTFWYTTLYDRQLLQFHALLIYVNVAAGKFEFEVTNTDKKNPTADWRLMYTALNENGNRLADDALQDRMTAKLQFLGESAKYYLETGNMLKAS